MIDFTPRHLQPDHLESLYTRALQEVELQKASAWLNHLADPNDPARKATYEQACEALERLEDDCARVCGPPMEVPQESAVNSVSALPVH